MKNESLALFACYMKRTLFNARIDYLRKQSTIKKHEVMAGNAYDDEVAQLVSGEQSPLEQVAAEASLQRALDSLSKTEAYVIYHSVCLDEPAASIAWHLGIAEKSVSRIKRRALVKLRRRLGGGASNDGF